MAEEQTIENDGSLAAATNIMPDIEALEAEAGDAPVGGQDRGEDGRFKAKESNDGTDDGEDAEVETEGEDKPEDAEADAQGDVIEFEDADGNVQSIPLERVLEHEQTIATLTTELEQAKQSQPAPEQYVEELRQTVAARQKYLAGLQQIAGMITPQQPDQSLLDPNHQNFDPEAYRQQLAGYNQAIAQRQSIDQEHEQQTKAQQEQEAVLRRDAHARERAKVLTEWPELKDEAFAHQVAEQLNQVYGIDGETLDSILDARLFKLAKDAIAYRNGQSAQKKAAKVVKGKPRLVRAGQRPSNPKSKQRTDAMQRLSKSGSVEDAAHALDQFL